MNLIKNLGPKDVPELPRARKLEVKVRSVSIALLLRAQDAKTSTLQLWTFYQYSQRRLSTLHAEALVAPIWSSHIRKVPFLA